MGYDEVCRLLDTYPHVRQSFAHLLTGGDVIAHLLGSMPLRPLDQTVKVYLADQYRKERYAHLDQAGDVGPDATELARVFADVHAILRANPTLLIFDGLGEVVDPTLRGAVLGEVGAFLERAETALQADMQVVGSSRPNGYSDEFPPSAFLHLELVPMDAERVNAYVERWLASRELDDVRAARIRDSFAESAADAQLALLLTTPLQVSIVI